MCLKHQLDAGRDWFSPDIASWHTCAWIRLIGWHSWRDSLRKMGKKTFWSNQGRWDILPITVSYQSLKSHKDRCTDIYHLIFVCIFTSWVVTEKNKKNINYPIATFLCGSLRPGGERTEVLFCPNTKSIKLELTHAQSSWAYTNGFGQVFQVKHIYGLWNYSWFKFILGLTDWSLMIEK